MISATVFLWLQVKISVRLRAPHPPASPASEHTGLPSLPFRRDNARRRGQTPPALMPLSRAASAASVADGFGAGHIRRQLSRSARPCSTVEAAASVTPGGVINELDVNVFVRETNAHARTFLRAADFFANAPAAELRQFLFFFRSHFNASRIWPWTKIVTEPSCLPCARRVRPHNARPCPCKVPADKSARISAATWPTTRLVRPFDGQLGVFLDRHLDLVGNGVIDRMRIAERQVHDLALNGGLETDALNFEFLDKTFGHALDHVVDERAAQAVQRLGLRVIAVAAHDDFAALDLQAGAAAAIPSRACPSGLRPETFCPLTSTLTLGGMAIGCFPIRDIK